MRLISGNFAIIEFSNELKQFVTLIFKVPSENLSLVYRTIESAKVKSINELKSQIPILVFESYKLKNTFFNNYSNIKLGKFEGVRYNQLNEPKVFSFTSNILNGRWEINTIEEKRSLPVHKLMRVTII